VKIWNVVILLVSILILFCAVQTGYASTTSVIEAEGVRYRVMDGPPPTMSVSALPVAKPEPAIQYEIVDLGNPGQWQMPTAMNNTGQVVGWEMGPDNKKHGFISQDRMVEEIGGTEPVALNDWGMKVGIMFKDVGLEWPAQRACLWLGKEPVDLNVDGLFPGGATAGYASAVNNRGQIVVEVAPPTGAWKSFLVDWGRTTAQDLHINNACAINEAGQIPGRVNGQPCLRQPDGEIVPLPTLAGTEQTYPSAINEKGMVVGNGWTKWMDPYSSKACVWQKTRRGWWIAQPIALQGYENAQAHGINDLGQVVGEAIHRVWTGPNSANLYRTPFMWEKGRIVDLADRTGQWKLRTAISISDDGEIAAYGWRNGEEHAVLLVPIKR
jgi:uncharacterized membrane protein